MTKRQLFERILALVSQETEVPEAMILSPSKIMYVVDARSILIQILTEQGLYPVQIAELLYITASAVRNLISRFHTRQRNNPIIATYLQQIRNSLAKE